MFFLFYAALTGTVVYLSWVTWQASTAISVAIFAGMYLGYYVLRLLIARAQMPTPPSRDGTGELIGVGVELLAGMLFGLPQIVQGVGGFVGSLFDDGSHEEAIASYAGSVNLIRKQFGVSLFLALVWTVGIAVWAYYKMQG